VLGYTVDRVTLGHALFDDHGQCALSVRVLTGLHRYRKVRVAFPTKHRTVQKLIHSAQSDIGGTKFEPFPDSVPRTALRALFHTVYTHWYAL